MRLPDFTGDAADIYIIVYNNERLLSFIFVRMFWRTEWEYAQTCLTSTARTRAHRHGALTGVACGEPSCGATV